MRSYNKIVKIIFIELIKGVKMSSFNDFLKEEDVVEEVKNATIEQDVNELIDKYSTYSQEDLMAEFLKESERKKLNGELDDGQLSRVKNILAPYLSAEQQEKLNNLLNMVK